MCVVLVHEGEGHGRDGVEEEGGARHGQVPALVLCCSSQPEGRQGEHCLQVLGPCFYSENLFAKRQGKLNVLLRGALMVKKANSVRVAADISPHKREIQYRAHCAAISVNG